MVTNLHKNILATVTYYDVLDYPLTPYELWQYLISYDGENTTDACQLRDVVLALETAEMKRKLAFLDGFVFLPGRGLLVAERIAREKISARKLAGMKTLTGLMRFLPFVRMIGATGSLSLKHGTRTSDWDMFIVFEEGKIWIGRLILTLFLHVIGKRRHGTKVTDRACLNYFITTKQLEILNQDLYAAHEYQTMRLLYGEDMYQKFILANRWIKRYKPNYSGQALRDRSAVKESKWQLSCQQFLETLFKFVPMQRELIAWQKKKIANNPNTQLAGSYIEATDEALIFLPKPRGPKVFEAFKKRLVF